VSAKYDIETPIDGALWAYALIGIKTAAATANTIRRFKFMLSPFIRCNYDDAAARRCPGVAFDVANAELKNY
jgi:hypothetical protein